MMSAKGQSKTPSLGELIQQANGNWQTALENRGLHVTTDETGDVIRIVDPMMRGNFNEVELTLLLDLKCLRGIGLRGITLTKDFIERLGEFTSLDELMLEDMGKLVTLVDDDWRSCLSRLPNLSRFHLRSRGFCGAGLLFLAAPEEMRDLDFHGSPISDQGLCAVAACKNLEYLGLWDAPISDDGLAVLTTCLRLRRLDLYGTSVTETGLANIANLPELESLQLTDSRISDGCLPILLSMPKLKDVSVGDGLVSFSTYETLTNRGIEVEHGRLLNFRREFNYLRYLGVDFEVDTERSRVRAWIDAKSGDVQWSVDISSTDSMVPGHMQPASLDGPPFVASKDWKTLEGQIAEIDYDDDDLHPILPDNPCNIYVGWHACPNHHRIQFVQRDGKKFIIRWNCVALEHRDGTPEPVEVFAKVSLAEVNVYSDEALLEATANRLASDFLQGEQFELVDQRPTHFVFHVIQAN
jgi:hypothetical protein